MLVLCVGIVLVGVVVVVVQLEGAVNDLDDFFRLQQLLLNI